MGRFCSTCARHTGLRVNSWSNSRRMVFYWTWVGLIYTRSETGRRMLLHTRNPAKAES